MVDCRPVVAALLALAGVSAHAGYAQASPPSGWVQGGSGMAYKALGNSPSIVRNAANEWSFFTKASINVAGRSIAVDAALKPAANAARFVASRGFVLGGPTLVPLLAAWAISAGLEWYWDSEQSKWVRPGEGGNVSDGYLWNAPAMGSEIYQTPAELCHAAEEWRKGFWPPPTWGIVLIRFDYNSSGDGNGSCIIKRYMNGIDYGNQDVLAVRVSASGCPAGWYVTPAGCVETMPPVEVGAQEFEDGLATKIKEMPDDLPAHFPEPIPVELPKINPNPSPNGNPWPFDVPVSDPVPNPAYNPEAEPSPENAPYLQPMVRVSPSPTAPEPWRVDVSPYDKPVMTRDPLTDPLVNAPGEGNPESVDPKENPGLCEQYPDIVACQKLGELPPQDLPSRTVPVSLDREEGFGPSDGVCPAPKEFTVMGKTMAFRWDLICDFATGIRPLLIGFAYLSAVLVFFGLWRRE